MKTLAVLPLLIILLLAIVTSVFGNNEKYYEMMKKNIKLLHEAKTSEDLQAAVNSFERIASVETTKWEPSYYAAFGYLMMCNRETDGAKKDLLIDQAFRSIEKAKLLSKEESEIFALEGFAYMMRVTVDPASRGPMYAATSVQAYEKALMLNPGNPRALVLLAQMQYGTAQFFGSDTAEACKTLEKSLEKFDSFQSENVLAPQWGRSMAMGLKEKCK